MDDALRLLTVLTTAVCGVYVIAVILRLRRQCRDLDIAQRRWKELALEKNVSPDLEVVATEALVKELFRRSPAIILLSETKEGYRVQIYAHHMQVAQGVATRALEIMGGND